MTISVSGSTLTFSDGTTMTTRATTGPTGPTGPAGPTGPTGPSGIGASTCFNGVGSYVTAVAYLGTYAGIGHAQKSPGATVAGGCLYNPNCNSRFIALGLNVYCSYTVTNNHCGPTLGASGTWRAMSFTSTSYYLPCGPSGPSYGAGLYVRVS